MTGFLFQERQPAVFGQTFVAANGTAFSEVTGIAPLRARIDSILVVNTDSIAHVITLRTNVQGSHTTLGSASVNAGQGTNGTPSVDILAAILPASAIPFNQDDFTVIEAAMEVAVTGTNRVDITPLGGLI